MVSARLEFTMKLGRTIPSTIGNLKNLKFLHLYENHLTDYPEALLRLYNLEELNPNAIRVYTNSVVNIENSHDINGKRVLVVEDGPTLTHGGMSIGAGYVAAKNNGAIIVDPTPYLTGTMKEVFEDFPQIKEIVPAMGYNDQQIKDMEETLNKASCDIIVNGSPIDLNKLIKSNKPIVKVSYDIESVRSPSIEDVLDGFVKKYLK